MICFVVLSLFAQLGDERLKKYEQEGLVPFVVDAVYAMAHAIHNYYVDHCHLGANSGAVGSQSMSWSRDNSCLNETIKGSDLLLYIRNVSFQSTYNLHLYCYRESSEILKQE